MYKAGTSRIQEKSLQNNRKICQFRRKEKSHKKVRKVNRQY
jgi:hypothetical protein